MLKSLFFLPMLVAQVASAEPRLLCTDTGDLDGSYILDITGFEQILDGSQESMVRPLGFKSFRSTVVAVADLTCFKPNPNSNGSLALMVCDSGSIGVHRDQRAPIEAAISQSSFGLVMKVRGPGIPVDYSVSCQIKE